MAINTVHPASARQAAETVLRLRPGAIAEPEPGAQAGGVGAALRILAAGEADELDLTASVLAEDGPQGVLRLQLLLRKLESAGQLDRGIRADGRVLAWLRVTGRGRLPRHAALPPGQPVKLSRFAVVRAAGGQLVAQAPRSPAEVELAAECACLLGALAGWTTPAEIGGRLPGLPAGAAAATLPLLADAGLLAPGGPPYDEECDTAAQAQWSPADLWLHSRVRGPKLAAGYGGSYPMAPRFPPLPAVADPVGGPQVQLAVPQVIHDLPLSKALERRRSTREHDDAAPLTLEQLSELLYRTARIRATFRGGDGQEAADRPYPSGGAGHELEVYPLVTRCEGLAAGLWHYRAAEHALEQVAGPGPVLSRMVADARASTLMATDPQLVLIIAARFGRVMWKYDTIGYGLVLKHVGIYMQTVYLVATAMGLAVSGVGGGDAADFAAVSGLDFYAQGSVGEMILGSRPAVAGPGIRIPGDFAVS